LRPIGLFSAHYMSHFRRGSGTRITEVHALWLLARVEFAIRRTALSSIGLNRSLLVIQFASEGHAEGLQSHRIS
jgi:hypothetical protein